MPKRTSIKRPVLLLTLVLLCAILLTVLWNVVLVNDYQRLKELAGGAEFHTVFIIAGSALLLAIVVLSTILTILFIMSLRWSQRQSNFIASVSHELNSPLTSIKLFGQTLRNDELSHEDRARFVRKILADADRLSHLIANILRVAEVDNRGDELSVAVTEVDLYAYLKEYVADTQAIRDKVDLSLEGESTLVDLDPILFRQVLDNLVDNAVRYRGKGKARVRFRIVPAGDWTEFQAIDQGVGIPADRIEHVFDRFYRVEGEKPQGARGVGIGLNVVHSIVKSHGGTVGARSPGTGRGTTIWIRLPAVVRTEAPA